jgi:hypothetical protein
VRRMAHVEKRRVVVTGDVAQLGRRRHPMKLHCRSRKRARRQIERLPERRW